MKAPPSSKIFFYLLLAATIYITYLLVQPFLNVVVFSLVIVVTFKPAYDRFLGWSGGRQGIAVTATIATIFLLVLVPVWLVIDVTITQAFQFASDIGDAGVLDLRDRDISVASIVADINEILLTIPFAESYQLTEAEVTQAVQRIVQPLGAFMTSSVVTLGSVSIEWITRLVIFLSLLIALFPSYERIIQLIKDMSPLDDDIDQKYINRVTAMTTSMVKGVFVIALAQGLAAGVFFWIAGVKYTFFWTLLSIFFAFLPLGVNAVGIPIAVVLLLTGNIWQGVLVLAGCTLVITNIDNVLRPILVPKEAYLHPALVVLSAFGGLYLFGFLGVIYGPVIMIFLVTTIEIYLEYYPFPKQIADLALPRELQSHPLSQAEETRPQPEEKPVVRSKS